MAEKTQPLQYEIAKKTYLSNMEAVNSAVQYFSVGAGANKCSDSGNEPNKFRYPVQNVGRSLSVGNNR